MSHWALLAVSGGSGVDGSCAGGGRGKDRPSLEGRVGELRSRAGGTGVSQKSSSRSPWRR
jgi:hypothetical protein